MVNEDETNEDDMVHEKEEKLHREQEEKPLHGMNDDELMAKADDILEKIGELKAQVDFLDAKVGCLGEDEEEGEDLDFE